VFRSVASFSKSDNGYTSENSASVALLKRGKKPLSGASSVAALVRVSFEVALQMPMSSYKLNQSKGSPDDQRNSAEFAV